MSKLDELLKQILEVNNLPELTTSDGLSHPLAYLLMSNENCIDSSNHRQYVCRNSEN